MREHLTKYFFALVAIEGLLALILSFSTASDSSNAFLFGFSKARLAYLIIVSSLFLLVLRLTIIAWASTTWANYIHKNLDRWCLEELRLIPTIFTSLIFAALLLLGFLKVITTPPDIYEAFEGWAPYTFSMLYPIVERIAPMLIWIIAFLVESTLFLIIRYSNDLKDRRFWSFNELIKTAVMLLIVIATLFHWIILALRLTLLVNNPIWGWEINYKPFSARDLLFIGLLIALFGVAFWVIRHPKKKWLNLLLICFVGYFFQVGIGIVEGEGIESLREKFFTSHHRSYAVIASQNEIPIIENIKRYEELYSNSMFPRTKPPGLMAFYIGLERMINGNPNPSPYTPEIRLARLSNFIAWSFPILSLIIVFLFEVYARRILRLPETQSVGFLSAILFLVTPSIVMIALFVDQAIYPGLFLLGTFFITETIRNKSNISAFILGCVLYLIVFFTFSMLPLLVFTAIFAIAYYWIHRKEYNFRHQLILLVMIALGFLLLYLGFRLALNYDFLLRIQKTVTINHKYDFYLRVGLEPPDIPETLVVRVKQIITSVFFNNIEFATAVGIPIYILFIIQSIRVIKSFIYGTAKDGEAVQMALLSSFFLLNLAGTTQGEVARLWMFWIPMMAIFVAKEIEPFIKHKRVWLYVLLAAQLMTIVLTYHFQDLHE